MVFVSDQNVVAFQYESGTYANPSGAKHWIGLVTDHEPKDNENIVEVRYAGQSNRNVGQIINTSKDYAGTLTYHPQDFKMFGFALGKVVDSGSSSPFSHSITELNSDDSYDYFSGTNHNFPAFTVIDSKKGQGDGLHQIRTYKGAQIDTLEMDIKEGAPVECKIDYMAQSLTLGSKTADLPNISDEDTSRPYIYSDVKLHLPSGTVINESTEIKWSIKNNLDKRHYDNGSKVADNFTPLNREYSVDLTMDATSEWAMTLYDQYYQQGNSFNMMVESVISSGSEQGFIYMSGCKIKDFQSPSKVDGVQEYTMTIEPTSCNIEINDLIQTYNQW